LSKIEEKNFEKILSRSCAPSKISKKFIQILEFKINYFYIYILPSECAGNTETEKQINTHSHTDVYINIPANKNTNIIEK
jgi:hypothetical protein